MSISSFVTEAFTSTSDQAKLVIVVISSVIAVSVMLINQKITSNREKKAFLALKLEALYNATFAFEEALIAIEEVYKTKNIADVKNKVEIHNFEAKSQLQQMRMLKSLYFENLNFSLTAVQIIEIYKKFTISPFGTIEEKESRNSARKALTKFNTSIIEWCIAQSNKTPWYINLHGIRNLIIMIILVGMIIA